jgi:hypothetical protein
MRHVGNVTLVGLLLGEEQPVRFSIKVVIAVTEGHRCAINDRFRSRTHPRKEKVRPASLLLIGGLVFGDTFKPHHYRIGRCELNFFNLPGLGEDLLPSGVRDYCWQRIMEGCPLGQVLSVNLIAHERRTLVTSGNYIGLDVHQATISVAIMDASGKRVMESVLASKASTSLQVLGRAAGQRGGDL